MGWNLNGQVPLPPCTFTSIMSKTKFDPCPIRHNMFSHTRVVPTTSAFNTKVVPVGAQGIKVVCHVQQNPLSCVPTCTPMPTRKGTSMQELREAKQSHMCIQ